MAFAGSTHPIRRLEQLAAREGELLPAALLDLPNPLLSLNIADDVRSAFRHRLITANLAGRVTQPAIELYRYPPGTRVAGGGTEPYVTLADSCLVRQQLPEDIVGALIFLCAAESDFITGQSIPVDGGSAMN